MYRKYSFPSKFRKPLSLDGLYYSHGFMCASYPRTVIAFVAFVVFTCSLPFFITSSGDLNKPKSWRSPWLNFRILTGPQQGKMGEELEWIIDKPSQSSRRTPSWFLGLPVAVIQQVYVNLDIDCHQMEELCDKSYHSISKVATAHLLSKMEHVISVCRPVIHPAAHNLSQTLTLDIPSPPPPSPPSSPPSGVLSPLLDSFRTKWGDMPLDYHSIKELIYGGFWEHEHHSKDSGASEQHGPGGEQHDPSTPRERRRSGSHKHKHHSFAVSLLLKSDGKEDFSELVECVEGLKSLWPDQEEKKGSPTFMKHFYYEPDWSLLDFAPLMGVYSIVFLYISFSVGKIDLVKSKIGLGFTAFITVVAALTMSLGICTFFGLSISLSGSEIYPYVVITIGLENILIIVKAVMSTPEELEVKYRIAVGLSKEGRAITRNLITLVTMTSVGIVFFNYVLKEFCIIALVGLMCDGFLQLVFFPTVLSIDLRRLELSDLNSTPVPVPDSKSDSNSTSPYCRPRCPSSLQVATPMRWRSKRIKFIYFLARTRLVSKFLMLAFLVALCAIFVKTDFFHNLISRYGGSSLSIPRDQDNPIKIGNDPVSTDSFHSTLSTIPSLVGSNQKSRDGGGESSGAYWAELVSALNESSIHISRRKENGFSVTCEDGEMCWRPMVITHWPRLFNYSGQSMDGKFLTLLSPINLDFNLGFGGTTLPSSSSSTLLPLVHFLTHPLVIRITFIVALVVIAVSYALYLIRSSRLRHERYMQSVRSRSHNRMACLKGHRQDIDYLCQDGGLVVTTSLDGDIRVWDAHPMKRRCSRIIARSELYREPPPEVSRTSDRPAAEGCEANDTGTPTTNIKYPALSKESHNTSRRGSIISSKSIASSISDYYDYYSNRGGGPPTGSKLSSIDSNLQVESDYSDSNETRDRHVNHTSLTTTALTSSSPILPSVPIRRYSSDADNTTTYSSPHVVGNTTPLKSMSLPSSGHGNPAYTCKDATRSLHRNSVPPVSNMVASLLLRGTSSSTPASNQQSPTFVNSQARAQPSILQPKLHLSQAPSKPPLSPKFHHPSSTLHSPLHSPLPLSPTPHTPPTSSPTLHPLPTPPSHHGLEFASSSVRNPHAGEDCKLSTETSLANRVQVSVQLEPLSISSSAISSDRLLTHSSSYVSHQEKVPELSSRQNGRSDVPDIHIDAMTATSPSSGDNSNHSKRRGHFRHSSLGGNIPHKKLSHSRNRSLGSINTTLSFPLNSDQGSRSNLSVMSNASIIGSQLSVCSHGSLPPKAPDPDNGYDFAQHFNLFSQYTSNLALECYVGEEGSEKKRLAPPPVWCMAFWKGVVAVGCGNGQVEAWNANTGSLIFSLNMGSSGVSSITMSSAGIVTGQMDGTMNLIGYNGLHHHCVPAHDRAICQLQWYGDKVITGSYDSSIKVHRTTATLNQLVWINSVFVHEGTISALAIVESQLKLGCVSGCCNGLVIHWDIETGDCINEFGMYNSPILQLEPIISSVIGLFSEGCVRVWNIISGDLLHTMILDGVCHDFTVLSSQHIAVSLESSIAIYDLETGKPHSEKPLDTERGMSIIRHIHALDGASVVCSSGKEMCIVPCDIKLKND